MITRAILAKQLLAYLNHEISLAMLVDWAEDTFIDDVLEPEADIDLLNDILSYLAAADTPQFPLTWEICSEFLARLGVSIKIVAEFAPGVKQIDTPHLMPI
ncbi:MAG: hypothetical protein U0350_00550 [Caldilineaceae bacterium]